MQNVSAFHTWLTSQSARHDEVGSLARFAESSADWPARLEDKEGFRAWLRAHGHKAQVAPLAMAWSEFSECAEAWTWIGAGPGEVPAALVPIASRLLSEWWASGHPDLEEIEARAGAGEPTALALLGLHMVAGIRVPVNPLGGIGLLERAFDAGCQVAAPTLWAYFLEVEDPVAADEWLKRGARAGVRSLGEESFLEHTWRAHFGAAGLPLSAEASELAEIWRQTLGETGEVEFLKGRSILDHPEGRKAGLAQIEAAAQKGWRPAFHLLADAWAAQGQESEATEVAQRGAALGDLPCRVFLAQRRLRDRQHGAAVPAAEGAADAACLEEAAEGGNFPLLALLSRFYLLGEHVPADPAKAALYFSALLVLAPDEASRRDYLASVSRLFPGGFPELRVRDGVRWILEKGALSSLPTAHHGAATVWIQQGFAYPPPADDAPPMPMLL